MSRGWHQGLGHTRGFYDVAEQQHQQQRGQEGSLGLRSAFRQLQEPSWLTPEAPFQSSRTGEEWGWGHGVNWGPGENWRWQHCDRVPNATDMGPHGGSFQPSYPHWGQQCDWELNGAAGAAGASWNLAQQQQHLDNWRPNDCFQQSLSYSTPTAGYWQELPYHNNSANASMLDTSDRLEDTGMIRSESRSQFQSRCRAFEKEKEKAKVSKEVNAGALKKDGVKILEKNTMSLGDRLAMLEERNPTQCSKKKGKVSSSGAVVPKKKKKKKSKNKVKRLQDTPGQPNKNGEKTEVSKKGKSKIKKLQNMSVNTKLDRNKIFQSLKAAGESIKETVKGQVDKVKNILKPKSKKGAGGQRFSEVISKEGVKVGLTLDPYLMDLSEVEKLQMEEEELFVSTVNWEEDLMLWEEGWGRDFKLKRVNGEEEEEDLRSPHWEDVKEVTVKNLDFRDLSGNEIIISKKSSFKHLSGCDRQSKEGSCQSQVQQPRLLRSNQLPHFPRLQRTVVWFGKCCSRVIQYL